MYIAQELRKKNIAEYLLYMWQIEDTIRAFGCSLPRIRREYVDRFDYSEEQKEEETDWFGNLIRMMNEEGCRGADKQENEIETCMNLLYGVMMLRLQKKAVSPDTEHAVKEISTFIGMLSDYYKKDKEEGLRFE